MHIHIHIHTLTHTHRTKPAYYIIYIGGAEEEHLLFLSTCREDAPEEYGGQDEYYQTYQDAE